VVLPETTGQQYLVPRGPFILRRRDTLVTQNDFSITKHDGCLPQPHWGSQRYFELVLPALLFVLDDSRTLPEFLEDNVTDFQVQSSQLTFVENGSTGFSAAMFAEQNGLGNSVRVDCMMRNPAASDP
jgi:hypothetical protein